jgi:dihydroflavonol-4-reductase
VDPVLLTGGSGFVGGALLERLTAEGREVRALVRSEAAERAAAARGSIPVRGDLLDERSLRAAAAGCRRVFHVAGVNAMCRRDPRPMVRTNVQGTENVIRAAAAVGVERVVVTSSAVTVGEARGTVGRTRLIAGRTCPGTNAPSTSPSGPPSPSAPSSGSRSCA